MCEPGIAEALQHSNRATTHRERSIAVRPRSCASGDVDMIKTTPGAGAVGPVASHGLAASVAQRPAPSGASVLDPTCPAEGLFSLARRPPTRCFRPHSRGARRARSRRMYPSHSQRSAHASRSLFSIRHSRAPRLARIADVSRPLLEPRALPVSRAPRSRGCPHREHPRRRTAHDSLALVCTRTATSRTAAVVLGRGFATDGGGCAAEHPGGLCAALSTAL